MLPDEQYVMISDSIEKKNIARSSRCRKTHCGKGGRVKFPSDYKTKKELKAMNGEVKSYNLNKPMTWEEFKKLPDDLKITYIKKLRNEFKVPDKNLAEAMGVSKSHFCKFIKDSGLSRGRSAAAESKKWEGTEDQKRFYAWCGFYQKNEEENDEPAPIEENVAEPMAEEVEQEESVICETSDKKMIAEAFPSCSFGCFKPAIPTGGRMSFDCRFEDAIKVLEPILTGNRVRLNIDWIVVKEN